MKYVYTDEKIDRSLPENVPVRFLLATLFAAMTLLFLFGMFSNLDNVGSVLVLLLCSALCGVIAFLMIFFTVRTILVIRGTRTRTWETVLTSPKPFYSSQCPYCEVLIDYQRSDLAYRLWFRKGYVECPCCHKPIRHDSEKNYFIPHRTPKQ